MGAVRDLGLLALRVGVGGITAAHGAQKLFGLFGGGGLKGTAGFFESAGFVPGYRNAILAGLCETGGGAALALGLATGPAGAALAGNMTVASSVHAPAIFNTDGGLELPATYALVGATLGLIGPGRFSVDAATGSALSKPWMTAVALVGAAGSAAYLISERKKLLAQRGTAAVDTPEAAVEDAQSPEQT